MKITRLALASLLGILLLIGVACGGDGGSSTGGGGGTNQNVIGTYINPKNQNETMEIKADGTWDGLTPSGYYVTGTWRVDGNTIWTTQTGDETTFMLKIQGNYLIYMENDVWWVKQ